MEAYAGRGAMEAKAREEMEDGHKTKLFELAEKHNKDRLTSGIWERALDHDDELAKKLIERALEALGAAIGSAVNLIDPEAVIFGGGMGLRFGDRYGKHLQKEIHKHLFVDDRPPDFKVAELGDLGGAIGASLLAAKPPVPA
jgi:glucokinase